MEEDCFESRERELVGLSVSRLVHWSVGPYQCAFSVLMVPAQMLDKPISSLTPLPTRLRVADLVYRCFTFHCHIFSRECFWKLFSKTVTLCPTQCLDLHSFSTHSLTHTFTRSLTSG